MDSELSLISHQPCIPPAGVLVVLFCFLFQHVLTLTHVTTFQG